TCRVDRPSTWRGSPRPALLPPSACARAAWCAPAGRGVAPLFRHRPAPSVWLLWIIRAQDPTTGCPGPGFYGRTHGRVKTGEEGRGASRWVAVTRPRTAALRAGGAQRGNARPAYSGGGVNRWVGGTAHPRPAAMAACGIQRRPARLVRPARVALSGGLRRLVRPARVDLSSGPRWPVQAVRTGPSSRPRSPVRRLASPCSAP